MSPSRRHDLGQNDLIDRGVIDAIVAHVASSRGAIVELAAGSGRITVPLAALGRPLTAVELDPRRVSTLRARLPSTVTVIEDDLLRARMPTVSHTVVANLPFHLTTAALRRLLAEHAWSKAVLIMQWEAARRRAAIGGGSLLTAQWMPWFEFRLDRRIPSTAFRPRPSVDAALLIIDRRPSPLVPERDRGVYQRWVASVFAVPGSVAVALARAEGATRRMARKRCRQSGVDAETAPSRLTAEQWSRLWLARPTAR